MVLMSETKILECRYCGAHTPFDEGIRFCPTCTTSMSFTLRTSGGGYQSTQGWDVPPLGWVVTEDKKSGDLWMESYYFEEELMNEEILYGDTDKGSVWNYLVEYIDGNNLSPNYYPEDCYY